MWCSRLCAASGGLFSTMDRLSLIGHPAMTSVSGCHTEHAWETNGISSQIACCWNNQPIIVIIIISWLIWIFRQMWSTSILMGFFTQRARASFFPVEMWRRLLAAIFWFGPNDTIFSSALYMGYGAVCLLTALKGFQVTVWTTVWKFFLAVLLFSI